MSKAKALSSYYVLLCFRLSLPSPKLTYFVGADVIGLNCCFDPQHLIKAMKEVKESLEKAGFKKHLICQPLGKLTPDAAKDGYGSLPEFPFGKFRNFQQC